MLIIFCSTYFDYEYPQIQHVVYLKGMDEFQGQIVHPHDYKDSRGLEDKRVVVIGTGNSGADCVIETSRVAKQVS